MRHAAQMALHDSTLVAHACITLSVTRSTKAHIDTHVQTVHVVTHAFRFCTAADTAADAEA